MTQDKPNKEALENFDETVEEVYDYDKLKDCSLNYLHDLEHRLENDRIRTNSKFPPQESAMQGELRELCYGDSKVPLSEEQSMNLRQTTHKGSNNISRAKAGKIQERREYNDRILKKCVKGLGEIRRIIDKILPW